MRAIGWRNAQKHRRTHIVDEYHRLEEHTQTHTHTQS